MGHERPKRDLNLVIEAEQRLLGSLLRRNESIDDVLLILRAEDFYREAHQRIFHTVAALWEQGRSVDALLLADELHRSGQLEDAGGYGYLSDLLTQEPTGALAEYYAELVRDDSLLRGLERSAREMLGWVKQPIGPATEAVEAAERLIYDLSAHSLRATAVTLEEALATCYDRIDALQMRPETLAGVATGFLKLDEMLAGLQGSNLVVLAARPSAGKTAAALGIARNIAQQGKPVLFVSMEQSRTELSERLLCREALVDSHHLRRGELDSEEIRKLLDAGGALRPLKLYIDDAPAQTVSRIAAVARRFKRRGGLALVVVDYLQLVEPDSRRAPRHEQVAEISKRLKRLARELDIPVVALAQLNRNPESREDQRPRLSDLKSSGDIEQDADVVLLLHRREWGINNPMARGNTVPVDVIIAKHRNGPVGEVTLIYVKPYLRFEDYETEFRA